MFCKRRLDDQVFGRTMKNGRIELVAPVLIHSQVHISVMRYQGMDSDLWRDRQGKEPKQSRSQDRSYGPMKVQAVMQRRCIRNAVAK